MTERRCETCRFWQRGYLWTLGDEARFMDQETGTSGECRIRSTPSMGFPRRAANEWCGEHAPKATPAADIRPADEAIAPDGQPWGKRGYCWVHGTKHFRSYRDSVG